jgi:hypothetical protein
MTTISTDAATLRGMAEGMETAAVRMPPEQLNVIAILLCQAAINRAIAAEKEAQAAPGDLVEQIARALCAADSGKYGDPECKTVGPDCQCWDRAAAALSAITAAGYEIRPRGEAAGQVGRRLAEVTAERDAAEKIREMAVRDAAKLTIRAEDAEAALTRRDEVLRAAREALEATERAGDRRSRLLVDIMELDNARRITRSAIAKIDALTKPQEAGG